MGRAGGHREGLVFGDGVRVLDKGVWKRFKTCQHCQQVRCRGYGHPAMPHASQTRLQRHLQRTAGSAAQCAQCIMFTILKPRPPALPPCPVCHWLLVVQLVVERAKWQNCWQDIKYCSDRCKSEGKRAKRQQQQGEAQEEALPQQTQQETQQQTQQQTHGKGRVLAGQLLV